MSTQLLIALAVLAVAVVVGLALAGVWALSTAQRLDRLHVRYDLSWQALDGALARRAVVARAVASDSGSGAVDGRQLTALADAAERASRPAREEAENRLSAALAPVDVARLPTGLVAELADAEARVLLARRFHNDAVRDTLTLRERPLVRLLHLGGHAPLPVYFEIAERVPEPGEAGSEAARPVLRTSARVVLLDESGAVLLLCGSDPAKDVAGPRARGTTPLAEPGGTDVAGPRARGTTPLAEPGGGDGVARRWWFTVGGQVIDGEDLVQTAVRELAEETGLRADPATVLGPIWRRDAIIDFNGAVLRSREYYFVHRTGRFEPSPAGRTELERRYIHGHRWCDADSIAALEAAGQTVYPRQLGELLASANAAADGAGGDAGRPEPMPIR